MKSGNKIKVMIAQKLESREAETQNFYPHPLSDRAASFYLDFHG